MVFFVRGRNRPHITAKKICCQSGAVVALTRNMADGTYCAYFPFAILTEASLMRRYHNKLYFDEAILDGIDNKVGGVFAARLLEDVGTMLVYSALRDEEFVGNLLI